MTGPAFPVIPGALIAERLVQDGLPLPVGHTLWTLAERPDLDGAISDFNGAVWPLFMLQDPVADRLWGRLHADLAMFQLLLIGPGGEIVGTGNSAPLAWDGTDADLPAGWDAQFARSVEDLDAGRAPDTLGALQIVVATERQGSGLSTLMVAAFRAHARLRGYGSLIACVRPTWKERYPLTPIGTYAGWRRDEGQPLDPWIRVHARLGARIGPASPESMRIEGTVAEWERWTGLAFPSSGPYIVARAAGPVVIDQDADRGVYHDPNVWMVHRLES